MSLLPGYETVGLLAPVALVLLRISVRASCHFCQFVRLTPSHVRA